MSTLENILSSCVATCAIAILLTVFLCLQKRRLPPGPKGVPILGNVFDVPHSYEWLEYQRWGQKYRSDVVHFSIFRTHVFILNSAKAAKEILDKRSTLYSDREQTVMQELTGWSRNWALMRYGDNWRDHRRVFHQHFRPKAVSSYHPRAKREVTQLLRILLESPDGFLGHLRSMTEATILGIVYGIDIETEGGSHRQLVEKSMHVLAAIGNPGSFIVDSIPMLRYLPSWFPGAGFKRWAQEWKPTVDEMFERPFRLVQTASTTGGAKPCVATTLLTELAEGDDIKSMEEIMISVTGTAYAGGSDTSVTAITTFVLAMLLFPEAQQAAQTELDKVLGRDRLPSFEDRDALPYITALTKEVIRWRPILPLGVPHRCIADDEYEGFHIPRGSIIMGNTWAILHDENRYPNAEAFDPRRFLTADGLLNTDTPDPTETFGYSRRICPGRYFAMDMLWLTAANILAVFTIEKPVDENGQIIEPNGEFTSGMISFPKPFKAMFKPRFASAVDVIQSSTVEE